MSKEASDLPTSAHQLKHVPCISSATSPQTPVAPCHKASTWRRKQISGAWNEGAGQPVSLVTFEANGNESTPGTWDQISCSSATADLALGAFA